MGGSIGEGNTTASAEFNIIADPEAADVVFRSGVPITMIGLDVTHQALLDRDSAAELRALRHASPPASPPTSPTTRSTATWSGPARRRPRSTTRSPSRTSWSRTSSPWRRTTWPSTRRAGRRAAGRCATACRTGSVATAAQPNADVGIVIDRGRFERLLIDAFARLP